MDFHGAPLNRTWVKLGETAKKGQATVTLVEPVQGWRAGDRIILTGTKERRSGEYRRNNVETEERIVKAIEGMKLTLDKPLEYEHFAEGEYRGEVANLSRNVVVESAEPDNARGHTMYHRGSAGAISYAEFRHLGKENTLGRYSLHFHRVGETMRGSSVIGASIWDSGNRWLTIHGTNYLVVRDCVGYRSIGHGFFLEDGTEVDNVLDRNLAVQAFAGKPLPGQVLPFDRNDGAGFWWANSLNTFTRNVACENERYGYRFEATPTSRVDLRMSVLQPDGTRQKVDIRTLPFVRFEDNECHSDGLYGFNLGEGVDRIGPDERHPFVIRNMTIWATHYAFRVQSPSVLLEKLRIHRCRYGMYFLDPDRHVYRDLIISETPDEPWSSSHGDDSIQHGVLTVDGLVFENIRSTYNNLIPLTHYNASGSAASHFRNVKLINWSGSNERALVNMYEDDSLKPTPRGVPMYFHDYFGPNRHAKFVSTRAADLLGDGNTYREVPLLTGSRSRVAEVQDFEFPKLLDPVDDRPPTTVITHIGQPAPGKLLVRGTTTDNGTVKKVLVNGRQAKATAGNFAEWEIVLEAAQPGETKLTAHAEDAVGNVEKLPAARTSHHTAAYVTAVKHEPSAEHAGSAAGAAGSPTVEEPTAPIRPLTIHGADKEIVKAGIAGPRFHPPELFHSFEDYYNPRLKRLRDEYELDKVVQGEPSEFRRMLKLRHWVHSRWPIDNNQRFGGDAFAILEQAKTGVGFNCSHSMAVQQAV